MRWQSLLPVTIRSVWESDSKPRFVDETFQALLLADKPTFRNCLVAMRPTTKSADLPSSYDIKIYLNNAFVNHLEQLTNDIKVSYVILEKALTGIHRIIEHRWKNLSDCRRLDC
jgi:hypothetical protein